MPQPNLTEESVVTAVVTALSDDSGPFSKLLDAKLNARLSALNKDLHKQIKEEREKAWKAQLKAVSKEMQQICAGLISTVNSLRLELSTGSGAAGDMGAALTRAHQARLFDSELFEFHVEKIMLAEVQTILTGASGDCVNMSSEFYYADLCCGRKISLTRLLEYIVSFAVANGKVERTAHDRVQANNAKILKEVLNAAIFTADDKAKLAKLLHEFARKISHKFNDRVKPLVYEHYYKEEYEEELRTKKKDAAEVDLADFVNEHYEYMFTPTDGTVDPADFPFLCLAIAAEDEGDDGEDDDEYPDDEIFFPSPNLMALAHGLAGEFEADPNPGSCAVGAVLARAYFYEKGGRAGRKRSGGTDGATKPTITIPDREDLELHVKQFLNYMASPKLCPTKDKAVQQYQGSHVYVAPVAAPAPANTPAPAGKKNKVRTGGNLYT